MLEFRVSLGLVEVNLGLVTVNLALAQHWKMEVKTRHERKTKIVMRGQHQKRPGKSGRRTENNRKRRNWRPLIGNVVGER